MSLVVGQTVPVALQLFDGSTSKFPRAVIRNNSASTLSTVDLTHIASGLYHYNSYTMPDVPYITVQYIVYSDSGHTTIDTNYGYSVESYDRNDLLTLSTVESGYTMKAALRLILASLAGKLSGANTHAVTIRNVGDSKNRISATVDDYGNRSAITYDVSD